MQGIIGSVANSTLSQDLKQSVVTNDRESLMAALREAGVGETDIKKLDEAIDAEPEAKNGKVGEKVGAWIGGMTQKAVTGVWKAAKDKAIDALVSSVNAYYGIRPGG